MSNDTDTTTPETPEQLRRAAEDGRQARNENAELRKELLFAKAGIDTDTKIGSLLYKTWEGEDLAALKTEATELGLFSQAAPPPVVTDEDLAIQDTRSRLAGGDPAGSIAPEGAHPIDQALRGFHEDRKNGVRVEAAQLAAVDRLLTSADPRRLFNEAEWRQRQTEAGHGQ
jgi:hypothetical protein